MSYDIVAQTSRLHQSIGSVVVGFQFVEHDVALILASLIHMRGSEDIQRITAAMSFRQKVDLLCDLYPKRKKAGFPDVEIDVVRKSLVAAEEFRNAIVHSFWHIGDADVWMRTKSKLRTPRGLNITTEQADIERIEICSEALYKVRHFYLGDSSALKKAAKALKSYTQTLSTQR